MTPLPLALGPLVDPGTRARHQQSCPGKHRYATVGDAHEALARWQGWLDPTCGVYGCTQCGWYHLGRYAGVSE
jgi:hypothetical protein